MARKIAVAALVIAGFRAYAQGPTVLPTFDAFEVATIKPVLSEEKRSRYITMQGMNRFVEKDYTLKMLIAAAYSLSPQEISGGPGWIESDHFDITAVTPGEVRPSYDEQMAMLRGLLTERFKLTFHRQSKELSLYSLEIAKGGVKLKTSETEVNVPPKVGPAQVYPIKVVLPARNATMADFVTLMQRAILDRPVVDKTGLTGRYDFDLEWAPDETQFGGELKMPAETQAGPLYAAIQEQLGLRLVATKGPVEVLVVDGAERPAAD